MTRARKTAVCFRTQRSYICEESIESPCVMPTKCAVSSRAMDDEATDRRRQRFSEDGEVAHTARSFNVGTPGNQIHECGTKNHSDELGRDNVVAEIRLPVTISTRGNSMTNLAGIAQQLKKERDRAAKEVHRLDAALAALNGNSYGTRSGGGRLSAAARARIAAAQRARWAKVKRGQKANVVTMPKKRTMSVAARRRIAAAQRARWAKVKSAKKTA